MRKIICILLLIFIVLSGCSTPEPPEPTAAPEPTQVPTPEPTQSFNIDEYKVLVSELKDSVTDALVLVSNMGQYEFNYWETLENIGGTIDYDAMVLDVSDWMKENVDIDTGTLPSTYADISKKYKGFIKIDVTGAEAEEIQKNAIELYKAFDGLYLLVTSPSGSLSDFAEKYNDYMDIIQTSDSLLSTLLS